MKHRAQRNSKKFNNGELQGGDDNSSEKPPKVFKHSQIKSIDSTGTPNDSYRKAGEPENILKSQQYQNQQLQNIWEQEPHSGLKTDEILKISETNEKESPPNEAIKSKDLLEI